MARKLLVYGALLGAFASVLIVLFWGYLFFTQSQGEAHARGLEAAIFLLTTIVGFPLSLLSIQALDAVDYPAPLVWITIVVVPVLNFAFWGLLIGGGVDALIWLSRRARRDSVRT